MPNLLVTAALVGVALFQGAEEPQANAPVTKEAAPVEAAPAAPAAPAAQETEPAQGQPAPEAETAPKAETEPPGDTTEPLPDFKADAPKEENASEPVANTDAAAEAPSDELRRPTEQTSRSGKRVAAFWFISTGK